jgi:phosphoribosylamine-glycine ligase
MASAGYPGSYPKGKIISGLDLAAALPQSKVFHAGTIRQDGKFLTHSGRVLGVTAWAPSLGAARQAAYQAVSAISFEGAHFRADIGAKGLQAAR